MEPLLVAHHPHHAGHAAFPWSSGDMLASRTPPSSRPSTVDSADASSRQQQSRSTHDEPRAPHHAAPTSQHIAPADGALPVSSASLRATTSSSAAPDSDPLSNPGSPLASSAPSPPKIKVRSLQHIQSFANDDLEKMACSHSPSTSSFSEADAEVPLPQYEISEMPVTDVIEMVAGLLSKITLTNDRQHEQIHSQLPSTDGGLSPHAASVLSFHGKNIPSITIMSYLSRIHKYCPATYEVFLSLLVYFDRMTDKVNAGPLQSLRKTHDEESSRQASTSETSPDLVPEERPSADIESTPPSSVPQSTTAANQHQTNHPTPPSPPLSETEPYPLSEFFVVDSFNIHRLVIAGVTCASKFFSDVFYTNSRYAKVRRGCDRMMRSEGLLTWII